MEPKVSNLVTSNAGRREEAHFAIKGEPTLIGAMTPAMQRTSWLPTTRYAKT
jgi:hypothetical protein